MHRQPAPMHRQPALSCSPPLHKLAPSMDLEQTAMKMTGHPGSAYPAIPTGRHTDVSGINTFYIDKGKGDAIVLLHGSSIAIDSYITWFRTIEALSRHYRVIVFDQIGFGRSDMPTDGRYRDRLERCDHAVAFLRQIGVTDATLVGHSEGGFMAAYIALNHPDIARRLVIVTSGGVSPRLGGALDDDWIEASKSAYDYPDQAVGEDHFVATNSHLKKSRDPDFEAILRENYRLAQSSGQAALLVNLRATESDPRRYVELQEEKILPRLGELTIPVLLVWAADDATVPVARAVKLRDLIPSADLHVFHGAGHMVMHDRATDFSTLIGIWCRPTRAASP